MALSTVITSEEVNYLVYRYLLEAGFVHSAFTFGQESFVMHNEVRPGDVAPGLLISVLQRGLQYAALEQHINEDGSERLCTRPFNLLQPHVCGGAETDGATDMTTAMDAPLQTSVHTLNLALQNASIMATNAVYGGGQPPGIAGGRGANSAVEAPASKKKKRELPDTTVAASVANEESDGPVADAPADEDVVMDVATTGTTATTEATATATEASFGETEMLELTGHGSEVIGCAWNPTLPLLASASGDSTVRLWTFPVPSAATTLYEVNPRTVNRNARALEHVLIKDADRSSDVTCLEWRGDGTLLATGCYDGKARVWTAQGELVRTLQRHGGPIFAVAWNPSGKFLLTGSIDNTAIVWDAETGAVRHQLQHHTGACLDVAWRSETTFVSASSDKSVLFYDLSMVPAEGTGEPFLPALTLLGHTDEVNTVRLDAAGDLLASCSDDCTIRIWRLSKTDAEAEINAETDGVSVDSGGWRGECIHILREHNKEIYTLQWSIQGVLASASFDGTVRLWNPQTGALLHTLAGHTQPVYAIAFSPCGRFIASGSLDEALLVWSVETGALLRAHRVAGRGGIFDVEWMPTGDRLAVCYSEGVVVIFEFMTTTTGEQTGGM